MAKQKGLTHGEINEWINLALYYTTPYQRTRLYELEKKMSKEQERIVDMAYDSAEKDNIPIDKALGIAHKKLLKKVI